jgi:hypothetical protein
VKKPLRRLIAGLTLATAAAAGTLAATDSAAAADTAWDAPATTQDTGWGTPPVDSIPDGTILTPLDTGWG